MDTAAVGRRFLGNTTTTTIARDAIGRSLALGCCIRLCLINGIARRSFIGRREIFGSAIAAITLVKNLQFRQLLFILSMSHSSPPRKTNFLDRREREFLYLHEIDALITATRQTRSPIRNQALVMLLFCQALQPSEICWLRWCDLNSTANSLLVVRNRSKSLRLQPKIVVNQQPLCPAEIEILQELIHQSKTDWILESERQQRLSDRSLHHIVQKAGVVAGLPIPVHPYMLRRSGLYYRAALLLQGANLSLHECCLLWN
jgi:integrase